MIAVLISTGVLVVLLLVAFVPLEAAFAARPQRRRRPGWITDAAFMIGHTLLWSGLVVALLTPVASALAMVPLGPVREGWSRQPWILQAVEVVALGDLVVYWGHRASHRYEVLWRFHRVHHTAEHLDWLAAFREHPVDGLYTVLLVNSPAFLLGFPLETIAAVATFRGAWGMFIHANVRIELGPLKYLLGSPTLHHWHHDLQRGGDCNFANLGPWLDLLFGTYLEPPHEPPWYGVRGPVSRSYLGLLVAPLLRSPLR